MNKKVLWIIIAIIVIAIIGYVIKKGGAPTIPGTEIPGTPGTPTEPTLPPAVPPTGSPTPGTEVPPVPPTPPAVPPTGSPIPPPASP